MRTSLLVMRGLRHHRRMHLAVGLGVMAASATLTGALLVGDSMRGSLRDQALARLSLVDQALVAPRFFRAELAEKEFDGSAESELNAAHKGRRYTKPAIAPGTAPGTELHSQSTARPDAPIIMMRGGVRHADRGTRSDRVTILGLDERGLSAVGISTPPKDFTGRVVLLNSSLAGDLGAKPGDDVLINLRNPSSISLETLLGRRDEAALSLRVTVAAVIPDALGGGFSLQPVQSTPRNALLPLPTLQRTLDQKDRANALLQAHSGDCVSQTDIDGDWRTALATAITLDDYGLRLRVDEKRGYVSLESDALLLPPPAESAARSIAVELGLGITPILSYLATSIAVRDDAEHSVPYSVVAGLDPASPTLSSLVDNGGARIESLRPNEILLNEWTVRQLGAQPGEAVTLTYLMTGPFGRLDPRTADFTLRGIIAMNETAADSGFTPDYPGISDARSLGDWNPPFPFDLKRIRPADDDYWQEFRTAPKAFVTLDDAQRLWMDQPGRFGRLTAVRFHFPVGADSGAVADQIQERLRACLHPEQFGFQVLAVRADALRAARGATDFGMLFAGFSFFLIASAAMLTALLFRLGIELRGSEIGLLLAMGYTPRSVRRLLLAEGLAVSAIGTIAGLVIAAGYAWLMLAGLRSWWSAAANSPFLSLHVSSATLAIGLVSTMAVALASLAASVRGLTRRPPRGLLAGDAPNVAAMRSTRSIRAATMALMAPSTAVILLGYAALSANAQLTPLFFGVGTATLMTVLGLAYQRLRAYQPAPLAQSGETTWVRLGIRNASRHPGRSLLTLALMASAVFLIISVGAFRIDPSGQTGDRDSGYGGFSLLAESAVPLPFDLKDPGGRDAFGLTTADGTTLSDVEIVPFRLRSGDETSCLSLYQPREPRLLGAPESFIERGGFRFAASLAQTDAERANPWTLLQTPLPDGAIPVIGDEAAVKWQLKSGLGQDLVIRDERGVDVRLRFVALLSGSILQSELVLAESALLRLFPSLSGHSFFLMAAPPDRLQRVEQTLENALERYSFDVSRTTDRLASYVVVQNTYLRTFQTLGGLGLILGSAGLGVVMLRNVSERRGELALLRALGFTRRALGWMVMAENLLLTIVGLLAGVLPAIVAIAPQLIARPQAVPWASLTAALLGILVVGILSGLMALHAALHSPLLRALRSE